MQTIFITGANRGLGLEFVRQLLARDVVIIATCRQPDSADALQALRLEQPERLHILPLDVTDPDSIREARSAVGERFDRLDWLINNAGYLNRDSWGALDPDDLRLHFEINALGPLLIAEAFADLLREGERPLLVNISSQLGSLDRATRPGPFGYNASKAALNMYSRLIAFHPDNAAFTTLIIHPGWVQTDMGGSSAAITPEQSVSSMLELVDKATPEDNGRFFTYTGAEHAW